jgi:hypothetical protein
MKMNITKHQKHAMDSGGKCLFTINEQDIMNKYKKLQMNAVLMEHCE